MERLRQEKESVQTDNMFNQHDARETSIARRPGRTMPSRPKSGPPVVSPAGTPKKGQKTRGPLGDGFADDDVIMASPSRHGERQKTATPKQAGKRKRQTIDQSPIPLPALSLSQPRSQPKEEEPAPVAAPFDATINDSPFFIACSHIHPRMAPIAYSKHLPCMHFRLTYPRSCLRLCMMH